jgi:LmbE family N-acetylglucosaminyl deacetylase
MRRSLAPPGQTTRVHARRALVLAPHYDDDVFGCGGLLIQLADASTALRVVFVSDGSGGAEVTRSQETYAQRRRDEAIAALKIVGVDDVGHLDLPDGALAQHIPEIEHAIADELAEHHPDLVLAPSPLEITPDHQAVFAALHRVLTELRGDAELDMAALRVLLYEVNHPAYPNLLIDISSELERLSKAVGCHESQLELHRYDEAALGMRRYRTLSLPHEVRAAEGYYELSLRDLQTRSLDGLIVWLGGIPEAHAVQAGPLVSVIVRTMDRPDFLAQALASIAASTYRQVELIVVNDGGKTPTVPDSFPFPHRIVDLPTSQGRAAAANAGVEAATGAYVVFLDDDDLMETEHLATLVGLVSAGGVRVAYTDAAVGIYELDPGQGWRLVERRLPYSRDFSAPLLLLDNYIPFNTLIIDRELLIEAGNFDIDLPFFEDWDMLIRLSSLTELHHLATVTCEYRHFRGGQHHAFGERPSERSDFLEVKTRVITKHWRRVDVGLIAGVVAQLRAEAVELAERAAQGSRLERKLIDLEGSYHRLNGEAVALRSEREDMAADRQRLMTTLRQHEDTIHELTRHQKDLDAHLGRVYAEIERLNGIIKAMEGTRAWRAHRWLEKLKGRS